MDRAQGGGVEEVTGEITVTDGIHRVLEDGCEPQLPLRNRWVERKRRSGDGTRAERAHVRRRPRVLKAPPITHERHSMRCQVETERYGLCSLQMRVRGHQCLRVFLPELRERAQKCVQLRDRNL